MAKFTIFSVLIIYAFCISNFGLSVEIDDQTKVYIVYLGAISNKNSVTTQHIDILNQVVKGRPTEETIIRSYKRSFSGFAAKLTEKEYENLKSFKEVVSVVPSRTFQLQTTRSWDFIGLPEPTPEQLKVQGDIIIGVIDSGIWPESPSFNDDGLSPIPDKWSGGCFGGKNFNCNKKIIGAREYAERPDPPSPPTARDYEGHGTYVAATAAGQKVKGASFYGIANGTARGGVPSARIAVYKACENYMCKLDNIVAAFDDAIADGVDLITLTLGRDAYDFFDDYIAYCAFHAMTNGIITVQSAGNDGGGRGSVGSVAPWVFSVAASFTDRRIITKVVLGNGNTLVGYSVNQFILKGDKYPLLYGEGDVCVCPDADVKLSSTGCVDKRLVNGTILVCDSSYPYYDALQNGAVGVLAPSSSENVSDVFPLPAAQLNNLEIAALKSYLNSTNTPKGNILKSEVVNDITAPIIVAPFSSRGPNPIATDILKPDISAPGVDILAAFSPEAPPSKVAYNVLSGTSVACPHVAGAAAYVKSVHPDWSPAAVKSALMTTANPMSPLKNPDAEFAYGSGHINPYNATNPGLVYDALENDYITFLCKLGYDQQKIGLVTGNTSVSCAKNNDSSPKDVNYPTISAIVDDGKPFTVNFSRTVTNVGNSNSTYRVRVVQGLKIKVEVKPDLLSFKSLKETKSFNVVVVGEGLSTTSQDSASIVWYDGVYSVRSPIVVYTK